MKADQFVRDSLVKCKSHCPPSPTPSSSNCCLGSVDESTGDDGSSGSNPGEVIHVRQTMRAVPIHVKFEWRIEKVRPTAHGLCPFCAEPAPTLFSSIS
jgi:hypothetical protein